MFSGSLVGSYDVTVLSGHGTAFPLTAFLMKGSGWHRGDPGVFGVPTEATAVCLHLV